MLIQDNRVITLFINRLIMNYEKGHHLNADQLVPLLKNAGSYVLRVFGAAQDDRAGVRQGA